MNDALKVQEFQYMIQLKCWTAPESMRCPPKVDIFTISMPNSNLIFSIFKLSTLPDIHSAVLVCQYIWSLGNDSQETNLLKLKNNEPGDSQESSLLKQELDEDMKWLEANYNKCHQHQWFECNWPNFN